jgi:hypothetical protein
MHTRFKSSFQILRFYRMVLLKRCTIMSRKQSLHTLSCLFAKLAVLTLHLKHFADTKITLVSSAFGFLQAQV